MSAWETSEPGSFDELGVRTIQILNCSSCCGLCAAFAFLGTIVAYGTVDWYFCQYSAAGRLASFADSEETRRSVPWNLGKPDAQWLIPNANF
jgi:hypothetical protein